MADEIQDPAGSGSLENGSAGGGSSAVSDPRDARLAQLERYYAQSQETFERLSPHEKYIKALLDDAGFREDVAALDDKDYREFQRASRKSYYQMVEEQKRAEADALPPEHKRLLDEIDKRLKPVADEADLFRKDRETRTAREAEEAKAATAKFTQENLEYAQRLVAEKKVTAEEVADLGRFAKALHDETVAKGEPRFVGIEEVYKRLHGRAETSAAKPVPKSLRAKSGAPGVPGASKPEDGGRIDARKPGSFTNEMLKRLNSQRKVS
jgi:hypothetical protein